MIKIAILGFGNVGRTFARFLDKRGLLANRKVEILGIADESGAVLFDRPAEAALSAASRDTRLIREFLPPGKLMGIDRFLESLKNAAISVLVECMPTNLVDGQPALDYLKSTLTAGIHAVTVDKGPLVYGYAELTAAADRGGARLAYTGTTGVCPPTEIAEEDVREICGILNGTTNFILTEMLESGVSFGEALQTARDKGIAESNPELDVQGWDSSCKILILANQHMGAEAGLSHVSRVGIATGCEALIEQARSAGGAVRLLARARKRQGGVQLSVAPEIVGRHSPFHAISGTSKGASFTTGGGAVYFSSGISGRDSIARIILEDLMKVSRTKL